MEKEPIPCVSADLWTMTAQQALQQHFQVDVELPETLTVEQIISLGNLFAVGSSTHTWLRPQVGPLLLVTQYSKGFYIGLTRKLSFFDHDSTYLQAHEPQLWASILAASVAGTAHHTGADII
jgi:hypothetical protein